tara:strand:+ start:381 stop:527 length:147 start_codon:yes stop_codon:yes gene_type:complete
MNKEYSKWLDDHLTIVGFDKKKEKALRKKLEEKLKEKDESQEQEGKDD